MDTPKSDPIPKKEATAEPQQDPSPKTEAKFDTSASATEASKQTMTFSNPFKDMRMGSLQELMANPAFFAKVFAYSAAAIAVVGITGLTAANSVADAIRNQPAPQVNTAIVSTEDDEDDTEDSDEVSPVALTEICQSQKMGIAISYPDSWDCSASEETGLNLEGDIFTIVISDLGRGPYCGDGPEDGTCEVEDYHSNNAIELSTYTSDGDLGEVFGIFDESQRTNAGFPWISIIWEDMESEELTAQQEADLLAVVDSIRLSTPGDPYVEPDPYAGWKTYESSDFSIRYPTSWAATEEGNLQGASYKNLKLVLGNTGATIEIRRTGDNAFGFGPSLTYTEQKQVKVGSKTFTQDLTYFQTCEGDDPANDCGEIDNLDRDLAASIITIVETGIDSSVTDGSLDFVVNIWGSIEAPITDSKLQTWNSQFAQINEILSTFKKK